MVVGPVRMSRDVVSSLWIKRVPWANIFFAMVTAAAMVPALAAFGLIKLELVDADMARPVSIALAVALVAVCGGTAGTWRVLAFSNSFSEILWRWAVLEAERDGTVWIDVLVGGLRRGDKDKG